MIRDPQSELFFGTDIPLSNMSPKQASKVLREVGESKMADQLEKLADQRQTMQFGVIDELKGLFFDRIVGTTNLCAYCPIGDHELIPVSQVQPDTSLVGSKLKVTLDGLHIAKYPGMGQHNILFDMVVQNQMPDGESKIFHYNAKFQAHNGETVPVHNFPLFYSLEPSKEGIVFGFQTINVSSEINDGLLSFLDRKEFQSGLSLASAALPILGQFSEMAVSLTKWLAGQGQNKKIQEFKQGLDVSSTGSGSGLRQGTYCIVQIPLEFEGDWNWSEWKIDPNKNRLIRKEDAATVLDFNHLMFGIRLMA